MSGTALNDGKADANGMNGQAGKPVQPCPDPKSLKVVWREEEAYCHDTAHLDGTGENIAAVVPGQGEVVAKGESVGQPKTEGQNSFELSWLVCGVGFPEPQGGKSVDPALPAEGKLRADGMEAKTPRALALKRLPDKEPEKVSFQCNSPKRVNGTNSYSWTAAFKVSVKDLTIRIDQVLQIKSAWLGHFVTFDATADAPLTQTWGWVKARGAGWVYWDNATSTWRALPRAIGAYTVTKIIFVKDGATFKGRESPTSTWPEAFAGQPDTPATRRKWLNNIHENWDGKFVVRHGKCPGRAPGLCSWNLDIKVRFSDRPGDKLVYAVWATAWERSDASDWYITENRLGVAGHECGHLLGAYDEYRGGAIHPKTKTVTAASIMGQGLAGAKPRHLDDFRKQLQSKVSSWIGRDWELEIQNR